MSTQQRSGDVGLTALSADNVESFIPEITEIYAAAVRDTVATVEVEVPTAADMTERISALLASGYPAFVATDKDGRVLGYAYGGSFRSFAGYHSTVEHSIYIVPTAQRAGVGHQLMTLLIAELQARDFRQMIAAVEATQAGSLAFHKAFDFVEVGRLTAAAYKHERWCDVVFLQRVLGEGGATKPTRGSL